jgi:hypothetical protein
MVMVRVRLPRIGVTHGNHVEAKGSVGGSWLSFGLSLGFGLGKAHRKRGTRHKNHKCIAPSVW